MKIWISWPILVLLIGHYHLVFSQNLGRPKRTYIETKYTLERLARMGSDDPNALGTVQSLPMPPPDVIGNDLLKPYFSVSLK